MSLPALAERSPLPAGLKRSALLMRALGARAAGVWSNLSPDEAERLSSAMAQLPEDAGGEQGALRAYLDAMSSNPQATPNARSVGIWHKLSKLEGNALANLIQTESPQIIAVILSRLQPAAAASAVRALPRTLATEALKRLLHLGEIQAGALSAIEAVLKQAVETSGSDTQNGGHEHVARIFDSLDSQAEETLLAALDGAEPGARDRVRAFMFTFEDLAALDPASLQTILSNTDRAVLTVALKGAPDRVADAFFRNMTQRAGDLLRGEIAAAGPVRRSEIEAARNEMTALARRLVKRGDILGKDQDDELIE